MCDSGPQDCKGCQPPLQVHHGPHEASPSAEACDRSDQHYIGVDRTFVDGPLGPHAEVAKRCPEDHGADPGRCVCE